MSELKEKLIQFFDYIESQKSPSINNVIDKFRSVFENDYFINNNITNTAYYQDNTSSYYIKNSCGIVLSISSGDGDRYGNLVSHKGTDVSIASLLSKDNECKEGIYIFDESIYCNPSLHSKIESFLDNDLSLDSLKKNDDVFVYKTLPENVMKSNEILAYRYNQLKIKAELENWSLYNDYMISPYGGLDIEVIPVDELLYGALQKFKDDNYFFDKAITLFYLDFPNYFSEKIKECSHALYIIKHKKEYKTLLELKESIYKGIWDEGIDIDEINKQKSDKQLKITELLDLKKDLLNKKYNLIELIKGKKNLDKTRISLIDKSIQNIITEVADLNITISNYNEGLEDYKDLKNNYKTLQDKLKKPFENYSINPELMDIYINGEYGELVSLEELIFLKENYTMELKNLLENQAKAKKNYEYVKENFFNLEDNKTYEMEFHK